MRHQRRTVERELARLASGAHGIVTRAELLESGITVAEISQRLASGALLREYRGVYHVGHRAPSVEARYLAAVLACGPGALLCGRAAGHLLGLLKGPAPRPEVMAPTERRIPGVITRRSRRMDAREGTIWRSVPVTTVARTLVDLAATLALDELGRRRRAPGAHARRAARAPAVRIRSCPEVVTRHQGRTRAVARGYSFADRSRNVFGMTPDAP